MKFNRLFILEDLKKKFSETNFILFFKFQPMSAKQWFSFRTLLFNQGTKFYVLKKRELFRFLSIEKKHFSLDSDNVFFSPSNNLSFFFTNFLQTLNLFNSNGVRFFLIKSNCQLLTGNKFLNLFSLPNSRFNLADYFMFLAKTYHFLKIGLNLNFKLRLSFCNLILKE